MAYRQKKYMAGERSGYMKIPGKNKGSDGTVKETLKTSFRSRNLRFFLRKKPWNFRKKMYTKWFDCDKIKDTPVVRTRQTGDYIMLDEDRKKALRRFMIDEKIPADKRDRGDTAGRRRPYHVDHRVAHQQLL